MTTPTEPALPALALSLLPGVGAVGVRRRVGDHGSAAGAWAAADADAASRARALADARAIARRCQGAGIAALAVDATAYPARLRDLEDPPPVLFTRGAHRWFDAPAVAIVGARRATDYGRRIARAIAMAVTRRGGCVVSGLAFGIDFEAHVATLDAGGGTIAVLGTGADVAYPAAHAPLLARVVREGLVVSEVVPGARAHAGAFPRRNRLIAALADVIVVVEAGVRSGALITAQAGGALGRIVAAVPGPIDVETSAGTNQLLRDGAHAVAAVEDVLALLALTARGRQVRAGASGGEPGEHARGREAMRVAPDYPDGSDERRVLDVLACGPQATDDLVRACALSPRAIGVALAVLDADGVVVLDAHGLVHRRDAAARPG